MKRPRAFHYLIGLSCLTALSALSQADETTARLAPEPAAPSRWHYQAALPFGFLVTNGETARPPLSETPAQSSYSDIFAHGNLLLAGRFEARKDSWGLGADLTYMRLEATASPNSLDGATPAQDITLKQVIPEAFGFYRLIHYDDPDYPGHADLLFGLRYDWASTRLASFSGTVSWLEGLVGARALTPFARQFGLDLQADAALSVSSLTYNLKGAVAWRPVSATELEVGYRMQYVSYDNQDSADRELFRFTTQGPLLELSFYW